MKTPIKKFTSVFLSLLMLVSIFTVSGSIASAIDTDSVSTGEHTVVLDASFCDSGGYAEWYAWTWTGDNVGHWVQASGGTSSSDITYQGIEDNVVFARMNPEKNIPDWNNENDNQIVWNQTENLTVDGDKYVIDSWGDGWGAKLTGHWEGSGGDDTTPTSEVIHGNGTFYLDATAVTTGEENWYAWTWSTGYSGYWAEATPVDGGILKFDNVCENVTFARVDAANGGPSWDRDNNILWNQTGDLFVENDMYVITDWTDESGAELPGYWTEYEQNTTDPDTTNPIVTDPPTSEETTTPTSTAPTSATTVTDPVVTTEPASTIPTDPTYDDEDKNLYVSAKSNINIAGSKVKANGNTISVSFTLKAPEKLDDGQFFVTYDSSKLNLSATYNTQSSMFPVAKNATYNLDAEPSMIMFNFSGTEGAYDFTNGGVLINLVFTRKSASTVGTALVYLNVCDLNSKNTSYVEDGNIKNSTGLEVGQTVSEPAVTEPKDDDVATDANPNLTVNAYSNINHEIQKIVVDKNNVKVTFKMTVPELIAYGKGVVTYDSDKLALEAKYNTQSSMFTTLNSQTIYNLKAGTGTMMFSFTSADPSTQSGTYDFRTGGDIISLVFTLKQGATGSADVYLDLMDLGTFTKDYIEQGKSTPSTGDVTSNVILEAQTATTSSTDETSIPIASSTGSEDTTPTGDSSGSTTPNTSESATSPTANTTATTPKPTPKPTTQPTTKVKPAKSVGKGTSVASADKFVKGLKNDKDPKGSVFNGLKAKSSKVKKTSIKVTWSKVKKAKGYIVYGNKCGKSYKKIKTVKGTSYTQKKLKKGTYYKYLIMAYDKNNKILSTSKTLHVATTGGKYGNYKSVKLNKTKIKLKKGKTYKLKATCKKQSKKLKVKGHRKVKYESTNTKIATVSSSGKIKAKKKGTCYIYAYAQNGVYKKAKITVKKIT